jgi:signal transduction histidine kinase
MLRILVIDDNPLDRELARRALTRAPAPFAPIEVLVASGWLEARPILEAGGFDLVFLDFHLPGMSGLDVLRELAGRPHPPVIMLTGQDDVGIAVETLRAGATEYVVKGPEWDADLGRVVGRVVERVRLERELAASRVQLARYAAELEDKVAARTAVVRAQAAEIEALYLKAEEAARLKEEIVANVSHELRTPLNVILGYGELLEEEIGTTDPASARAMLAKLRGQAERLRELVESLLSLARLNAGTESIGIFRFTLGAFVAELRHHAERMNADRGLVIEWRVSDEHHQVEHDQEKIRTIAYHLLSNAVKFTSEGRVVVTLTVMPAGGIELVVADTGIGMPVDARASAVEDFRQLDGSSTRRYEGLGLGLGIVKRYTTLLGGTLDLDSAPRLGTRATVRLPPRSRGAAAVG